MNKEALKEVGKGLINIGNGIIIVTVINSLFNFNDKIGDNPLPVVGGIIITTLSYITGVVLISKGSDDE